MSCRISSSWIDLAGFPPGTQAAGSLVKVPLNLLERIIFEVEFSEQKEPANQSVDSLSFISLGQSFSRLDSSTPYFLSIWFLHCFLKDTAPRHDFQRKIRRDFGKRNGTASSLISSAVTVINICCMRHTCLVLHPLLPPAELLAQAHFKVHGLQSCR